jgi:hypothetical protein
MIMAKKSTSKPAESHKLPEPVRTEDCVRPSWSEETSFQWSELDAMHLPTGTLTLYKIKGRGWVVCALAISKASSRQRAAGVGTDRTYAIELDKPNVVTVGGGPHVEATVTVYVTKTNLERLQPLIDRYVEGLTLAGQIRDRVSSRRAQGQVERANGRTSWRWNS